MYKTGYKRFRFRFRFKQRIKEMSQKADRLNNRRVQIQDKSYTNHDKSRVADFQSQLVGAGYLSENDKFGNNNIDGNWGNNTEAAWEKAQADGYTNQGGNLEKSAVINTVTPRLPEYTPKNSIKKEPEYNLAYRLLQKMFPKEDENQYSKSKRYTVSDDTELTPNFQKVSRVGNMGLIASGDGTYKLYDSKGKLIDQCAQTRNSLERMLGGHNTDMNAWDSKGVYGDSTIYNGYKYLLKIGPYNKITHTLQNLTAAGLTQSKLKNLNLQTGDVVDLYSMNSAHNDEAWKNGTQNRSNSHTGVIYQPYKGRKDLTWVIHNINGKIYVDPMSKFMVSESGANLDWAPTGFHRPGTKEHPYVDSKGNYTTIK